MVVFSVLKNLRQPLLITNTCLSTSIHNVPRTGVVPSGIFIRCMSGGHHKRMMVIRPSNFQWAKFKDAIHFYTMLGVLPLTALVFFINVFIGPAELAEIPEGYDPKPWEYYKHPIKRWFARYVYASPQQEYEKRMHVIREEWEKQQLRKLEKKVRSLMAKRGDYQAWYFQPMTGKYIRKYRRECEEANDQIGSN